MDLRVYFHKIKQLEEAIEGAYAVVVSHETSDGGIPGVMTEVTKLSAATLVVEGKARLATKEEAESFQETKVRAKEESDRAALAGRVQLSLVSDSELKAIKSVLKGAKKE
jgi:hypothetical protein